MKYNFKNKYTVFVVRTGKQSDCEQALRRAIRMAACQLLTPHFSNPGGEG